MSARCWPSLEIPEKRDERLNDDEPMVGMGVLSVYLKGWMNEVGARVVIMMERRH